MDYIDNIYVINMDKSTDRLEHMNSQIPTIGKQFKRIQAVEGSKLSSEEIKSVSDLTCSLFCTYSMIGIFLSHKKAWETMINNNDSYAIIMEDDCSVVETFQDDLKNCINELSTSDPEWDFLYLGCFGACDADKSKYSIASYVQKIFLHNINKKPNNKYSFVPEAPVGFHCYVISQKCAKALLHKMNKVNYHVDAAFLEHANSFNVYASSKNLAFQYTNAEKSTQTVSFPIILNKVFDLVKCNKQISYSYYMSAPAFGIYKYNVNTYLLILLCVTLVLPKKYLKLYSKTLATYFTIELALKPSNYQEILFWLVSIGSLITLKLNI
jgi:GR25 family glycosyltransferase involved in LPS biosynthesis